MRLIPEILPWSLCVYKKTGSELLSLKIVHTSLTLMEHSWSVYQFYPQNFNLLYNWFWPNFHRPQTPKKRLKFSSPGAPRNNKSHAHESDDHFGMTCNKMEMRDWVLCKMLLKIHSQRRQSPTSLAHNNTPTHIWTFAPYSTHNIHFYPHSKLSCVTSMIFCFCKLLKISFMSTGDMN